ERQRVGADALVDAVGAARVQGYHSDPQGDAPGHLRRRRERREPIGLTGMVDPKGTVPPPFGLSRRRADDLGPDGGREDRETVSHLTPPYGRAAPRTDAACST